MKWLDVEDAHHTLSHEPDKNKNAHDKLVRINTWFAEELAYLLKKIRINSGTRTKRIDA
jgi:hypothetical protein